jgi:hypothetical protein
LQRLYTAEWVRTVRKLRPELTESHVRVMCDAAIALLQSPTEFHSQLSRSELTPLLAEMASQSLKAAAPAASNAADSKPDPVAKAV